MKGVQILLTIVLNYCAVYGQDGTEVGGGIGGATGAGFKVSSPINSESNRCYWGMNEYDGINDKDHKFEKEVACSWGKSRCQVKLEIRPTGYSIFKTCKEPEACERNIANNPQQCKKPYAANMEHRVCHWCCDGNLCNVNDLIPIDFNAKTKIPKQ
uniref:uncharacterized protein LOC120342553 n=1 Tax=Styela clava TaxID=7725 RepID=UPI00193A2983|nr:uncharacterized protein LOC120342553 [Styela clava]